MAINDSNRTRKTYSFYRAAPQASNPLATEISGGFGIEVTGDSRTVIISANMTAISGAMGALVGGSGGGGDSAPTYLVLSTTASLSNERVLSVSGTSGLIGADSGAGSTFGLAINNNVVATVSGTTFTGVVSASAGLSGSLQRVGPNLPYLLSQGGITLTTQSNGQIIISGSSGGAGSNPVAGTGILVAGSTVSINDNIVATVSGTRFTGPVSASAGFTGSLQIVSPGLPYLLSQGGITLTTQSNGQIIISGSGGGGAGNPTAGTGILVTGGSIVSINNNVVATVSGTNFSGPVTGTVGFTGRHIRVGPQTANFSTNVVAGYIQVPHNAQTTEPVIGSSDHLGTEVPLLRWGPPGRTNQMTFGSTGVENLFYDVVSTGSHRLLMGGSEQYRFDSSRSNWFGNDFANAGSINMSGTITVGIKPATTGVLAVPSNTGIIYGRNAANGNNVRVLNWGSSDDISLGTTSGVTNIFYGVASNGFHIFQTNGDTKFTVGASDVVVPDVNLHFSTNKTEPTSFTGVKAYMSGSRLHLKDDRGGITRFYAVPSMELSNVDQSLSVGIANDFYLLSGTLTALHTGTLLTSGTFTGSVASFYLDDSNHAYVIRDTTTSTNVYTKPSGMRQVVDVYFDASTQAWGTPSVKTLIR